MPFLSSPKPPKVEPTPEPTQEETIKEVQKANTNKMLSLERYLASQSRLGANELRGDTGAGLKL